MGGTNSLATLEGLTLWKSLTLWCLWNRGASESRWAHFHWHMCISLISATYTWRLGKGVVFTELSSD